MNRGLLYSVGMFINKVVPERVFRFRVFDLFLLDTLDRKPNPDFQFHACDSDADYDMAREVTMSPIPQELVQCGRVGARLLMHQTKAVAGLWLAKEKFFEAELGIEIQLPEDSRWIFAAYTDTDFRRRGLYRTLMSETMHHEDAVNERFFVCVNPCNRPSRIAHERSAERGLGRCFVMRIFGFGFCLPIGGPTVDRHFGSSVLKKPIKLFIDRTD